MIAKHHEGRWTKLISNWPEARKTGQDMGRHHRRIPTTSQNQQTQQRSPERHRARWLSWDSLESDCVSSRLKQLTRPTTPTTTTTTTKPPTHERTTYTTKDQDEGGAKDDDDTLLIHSQIDS